MPAATKEKAASRLHHRLHAFGPILVVFGLVVLLWTLVLVFSSMQQTRMTAEAQQQLRLINTAVVQQTRGLLRGIESDLQVLDYWLQTHPQNDPHHDPALAELMSRLDHGSNGMVTVGFASSDGHAVIVPGGRAWQAGLPPVSLPATAGETQIGLPVRAAPGQPWQWPVSRRIAPARNEIAGTVAWVDLGRLSAMHEGLRDKPAGGVTLTLSDGVMIVRTPVVDSMFGVNLVTKGTMPALPPGSMRGSFVYDAKLAGTHARIASYERLDNYPITVMVTQGADEAMAALRERRRIVMGVLGAITLLAFVLSALLARSQHATRRSQAELAALSAAYPLGLFRASTSGEITYANEAFFQKLGLAPDQMAWGWTTLIDEKRRGVFTKAWRRVAARGEAISTRLKIRRSNGDDAVLSLRTAALRVDGTLVGQVGSVEDITEHIEQQKAQRMLTAIFEKSTDVVAQLDPKAGCCTSTRLAAPSWEWASETRSTPCTFATSCPPAAPSRCATRSSRRPLKKASGSARPRSRRTAGETSPSAKCSSCTATRSSRSRTSRW